jgi:hypothetical protein
MKARRWILLVMGSLLVVCVALAGVSALINRSLPTESTIVARWMEIALANQLRQDLPPYARLEKPGVE